jgi:hypothetical protein
MLVDATNWWAGKKVLVAPAWIKRVDWAESKVHVTLTRAQIKTSPEYEPDRPVERAYETRLYDHDGHPRFGIPPGRGGNLHSNKGLIRSPRRAFPV